MSLSNIVPDGFDYWYYDPDTGLLLRNDTEYGWVAVTSLDVAEQEQEELSKALVRASKFGFAEPSDVLPRS